MLLFAAIGGRTTATDAALGHSLMDARKNYGATQAAFFAASLDLTHAESASIRDRRLTSVQIRRNDTSKAARSRMTPALRTALAASPNVRAAFDLLHATDTNAVKGWLRGLLASETHAFISKHGQKLRDDPHSVNALSLLVSTDPNASHTVGAPLKKSEVFL